MKIRIVSEFAGEAIAKRLSAKLKIAGFRLNDISTSPPKIRKGLLNEVVQKKSWIIEGTQAGTWTLDTIHNADFILVTDASTMLRHAKSMKDYVKDPSVKSADLKKVLQALNWKTKEVFVKFDAKRDMQRIIVFNELRVK
jgi:hypothetical protein